MNRPTHLRTRPIIGRAFGEDAVLIRAGTGHRGPYGKWVEGAPERRPVSVASAPMEEGQATDIDTDGARLDEMRVFWAPPDIFRAGKTGGDPSDADQIEYDGFLYRVTGVRPWHGFQEVYARLIRQVEAT